MLHMLHYVFTNTRRRETNTNYIQKRVATRSTCSGLLTVAIFSPLV